MPVSRTVKLWAFSWVGRAAFMGATSVIGQASSAPFTQTRGSAASGRDPFCASKSHSTQAQLSTTPAVSEIWTNSGVLGGSGGCQMLTYLPAAVATSYQSSRLRADVGAAPGRG